MLLQASWPEAFITLCRRLALQRKTGSAASARQRAIEDSKWRAVGQVWQGPPVACVVDHESWLNSAQNERASGLDHRQGQPLASVAINYSWFIVAAACCVGVLVFSSLFLLLFFYVCVVPGFCAHLVAAPIYHLVLMRRNLLFGKIRWPPVSLLSRRTPMPIVETTLQVQLDLSPNLHFTI